MTHVYSQFCFLMKPQCTSMRLCLVNIWLLLFASRGNGSVKLNLFYAFSNAYSNGPPERRQNHIGYICLSFLHCVFSHVSSTCLPQKRHNHTGCICLTFLHCAFSNASSNCLPQRMQSHIGYIYLTFLHCAFSNVSSNCLEKKRHSRIGYICLIFLVRYLCFSDEHLH